MSAAVPSWLRNVFHKPAAEAPAQTAFGGEAQEPVVVYTAGNTMEADLVIALLASENIPAFASGAALSQAFGLQIGPMAEVHVSVPSALAERARQIIEERQAGSFEEDADEGSDAGEGASDQGEGFSSNS